MRYILIVVAACLFGAISGYFHGYVYAVNSNSFWIAVTESNDRTSEFLEKLTRQIKETDWCEAKNPALKGQQHDK